MHLSKTSVLKKPRPPKLNHSSISFCGTMSTLKNIIANPSHTWRWTDLVQRRYTSQIAILQLPWSSYHWSNFLIASLIDSVFDHPDKHRATSSKPTTTDNMLRQFKNHLISLAAGFSTMNDALNFSVKDILYNLSKSYEIVSSYRISGQSPEIQHVRFDVLVFPVIHLSHYLLRFCFLSRCISMISFECT